MTKNNGSIEFLGDHEIECKAVVVTPEEAGSQPFVKVIAIGPSDSRGLTIYVHDDSVVADMNKAKKPITSKAILKLLVSRNWAVILIEKKYHLSVNLYPATDEQPGTKIFAGTYTDIDTWMKADYRVAHSPIFQRDQVVAIIAKPRTRTSAKSSPLQLEAA